jgi:hypothetical protein
MSDSTTEIVFGLARKRGRELLGFALLGAALVVLVVVWPPPGDVYQAPLIALAVLGEVAVAGSVFLWIRWLPRARALMRAQAWRPVAARVVRAGRSWWTSLIEYDDGGTTTVLRVTKLTAAHHALIARTGRVWIVGPDKSGWVSVRVDGSRVAFAARRVRSRSRHVPMVAAADVTALAAGRLRSRAFDPFRVLAGVIGLWAVPVALGGIWTGFFGAVLVTAFTTAASAKYTLIDRHLPALVAQADWVLCDVMLRSWEARRDGAAMGTGKVWLDDDVTLEVTMPNASVDLLAVASETDLLWFSQLPEAGKIVAVGYPGYPVVAVAKIG